MSVKGLKIRFVEPATEEEKRLFDELIAQGAKSTKVVNKKPRKDRPYYQKYNKKLHENM